MDSEIISFRDGSQADIETVLAFWRESEATPSTTDTAESLRVAFRQQALRLTLAFRGEELVGTLNATFDGWRGSIYPLLIRACAVAASRCSWCARRALDGRARRAPHHRPGGERTHVGGGLLESRRLRAGRAHR